MPHGHSTAAAARREAHCRDGTKTKTVTYDYSSRPPPRWHPLHDKHSLRRLRDLRATTVLVALRVIAVCFIAALAYVLVGSARPLLERLAAPAPVVTPFTRLAPVTVRQAPSTPTATTVPLVVLVPTVVPPTAVPVLPPPPKRAPDASPTATEDASGGSPTPTEDAPDGSPTATESAPGGSSLPTEGPSNVLPTITPLVIATRTAAPTAVPATPTPGSPAAPNGVLIHTVQPGESLWSIAQKYQVQYPDLLEANRDKIEDPGRISAGMELIIPALGTDLPTE